MAGNKIAAISIIKLQSDISDVSKDLKILKARSASASASIGNLGGMLGKLAGASAIIGTLKQLGGALIDNARRFEKYSAMLRVATGSAEKANEEFDRIKKFAIETPYTVDELTKSFVLLNNRGINPTNRQMMAMADLAASLGRSYEDMAMAALRASSGETERMRNMGIEASVQGDKIKLSFKGVTKTIDRNITSIVELLEEFGQMDGVFGTSQEIMETTEGKISNMADAWDILRDAINKTTSGPTKKGMQWLIDAMGYMATVFDPAMNFDNVEKIGVFLRNIDSGVISGWTANKEMLKFFDDSPTYEAGLRRLREQYSKLLEEMGKDVGPKQFMLDFAGGTSEKEFTEEQKKSLFDSWDKLQKDKDLKDRTEMFFEDLLQNGLDGVDYNEFRKVLLDHLNSNVMFTLGDTDSFGIMSIIDELYEPETADEYIAKLAEVTFAHELLAEGLRDILDNSALFLAQMGTGMEGAAERFKKAMINSLVAVIAKLAIAVGLAAALAVLTGGSSMSAGSSGLLNAIGGSAGKGGFKNIFLGLLGKASGGTASGLVRVGENGPETVALPQGSRVLSRGDTMNALAGRTGDGSGHVEYVIGNDALEGTLQRGRAKKNLM